MQNDHPYFNCIQVLYEENLYMKKKLAILFICTLVIASGCGKKDSGAPASSSSSPAPASVSESSDVPESEVEVSEQINLSSAEDIKNAGLTASELEEMEYYLSGDDADASDDESFADYPDDEEDLEAFALDMTMNVESAPEVEEMPSAGNYDSFVTLGEYKGLDILLPADAQIEKGVTANIDYTGTLDGGEFDGGSDTDYDVLVGYGALPEEFEEQLIGHKKGDEFTISFTFPADYYDDGVAGKKADFDVRVNTLYKETADNALVTLVDSSKVLQFPKEKLDEWRKNMLSELAYWYEDSSIDEAQQIKDWYGTEEAFDSNVKYKLKTQLVCDALLDREGITEDSADYQSALNKVLDLYSLPDLSEAESTGYSEASITLEAKQLLCEDILLKYCSNAG